VGGRRTLPVRISSAFDLWGRGFRQEIDRGDRSFIVLELFNYGYDVCILSHSAIDARLHHCNDAPFFPPLSLSLSLSLSIALHLFAKLRALPLLVANPSFGLHFSIISPSPPPPTALSLLTSWAGLLPVFFSRSRISLLALYFLSPFFPFRYISLCVSISGLYFEQMFAEYNVF